MVHDESRVLPQALRAEPLLAVPGEDQQVGGGARRHHLALDAAPERPQLGRAREPGLRLGEQRLRLLLGDGSQRGIRLGWRMAAEQPWEHA